MDLRDRGTELSTLRLDVGDWIVEIQVIGESLAQIVLPPLAHRATKRSGNCDLVVMVWDEASTGAPFPISRQRLLQQLGGSEVRRSQEPSLARVDILNLSYERLIALVGERTAVVWTESASELPYSGRGAPLHNVLHMWLMRRQMHLLHAASIGFQGAGALVVGPGGSGKSTTSAACFANGLDLASDDYTVASMSTVPRAFNLYRSLKLMRTTNRDLLDRLPEPVNADDVDEKLLFLLAPVCDEFTITCILVPSLRTGERRTVITPLPTSAEAFFKLAPSSVLQLPGADAASLRFMRELCSSVPTYRLELGTDFNHVAESIRELLAT
jgi:hypothetical protein